MSELCFSRVRGNSNNDAVDREEFVVICEGIRVGKVVLISPDAKGRSWLWAMATNVNPFGAKIWQREFSLADAQELSGKNGCV